MIKSIKKQYENASSELVRELYHGNGFGQLLTDSDRQAKLKKAIKVGWLNVGVHLAPGKLSGREMCGPGRTPECTKFCINVTGHGGIGLDSEGLNECQRARIARTALFFSDRGRFWCMLERELAAAARKAVRHELSLACRMNLTSDVRWEVYPCVRGGVVYESVFEAYQEIYFYDYTAWDVELRDIPTNYHLTYSLKENNDRLALKALRSGVNVAVVLAVDKDAPMPKKWGGRRVIDGDKHDLRFLDNGRGCFIGLRPKGKLRKSESSFVRRPGEGLAA